jgi:hypothetical protein
VTSFADYKVKHIEAADANSSRYYGIDVVSMKAIELPFDCKLEQRQMMSEVCLGLTLDEIVDKYQETHGHSQFRLDSNYCDLKIAISKTLSEVYKLCKDEIEEFTKEHIFDIYNENFLSSSKVHRHGDGERKRILQAYDRIKFKEKFNES